MLRYVARKPMVISISGLRVPSQTTSVRPSGSAERALVRLQQKELSELGARLAALRANLEQLRKIGLSPARLGSAAAATSSSSLDLTIAETAQTINSVAKLSGIGTGNFKINGVTISVDTSVDSLNDVISRINGASAGATASLDANTNFLTVRSTSFTANLTLDDDTSGFFTGVNNTPGTFRATPGDRSLGEEAKLRRLIEEIGKTIDEIFNPTFEVLSPALLDAIQDELLDTITDAFKVVLTSPKGKTTLRSGLGIDVNFTNASRGVVEFDPAQFARSFRNDFASLNRFLFRERDGLIVGLVKKLEELGTTPLEELDPESSTGFLVELRV